MQQFDPPNPGDCTWPRILVVGYWGVGKTCLIHRIVKSAFPGGDDYLPTLWDNAYLKFNSRQNKEFLLELYEAHSREEYDRLRPLSYLAAHFVIICYPCAVPKGTEKFTNRDDILTKTEEIFISEWMRYANGAPGALARLKCDLEENGDPDRDQYWICEWEDAEKLKKKHCLMAHFKCSALDGSGVQEMIEEVTAMAEEWRQQQPKRS